ncbi:MAG: adenylate/guanylate cyclase domain-containing protein [Spirochaetes bacterium]|nr:adenylate/guanylate cyclase domain-containing protein [Spirochaetota bacterium]
MKSGTTPLFKRILHVFFKKNKLVSEMGAGIREVYFGLRARIFGLLVLVIIIIISALTVTIYLNNRTLIEEEKEAKAVALTRILTGPAEFYLDKDIETSKEEIATKREIIERESRNFINYNDDIVKIVLTSESGRVKFSTLKYDYYRKDIPPYIRKGMQQEEEKLLSHDYTIETKDKKTGEKKINRYRAITYPIFLHSGSIVDILDDFKRLYDEYYTATPKRKNQIYYYLWNKYKDILGEDFEPVKKKKNSGIPDSITKENDIDFLFLSLLNHCMKLRSRKIAPKEAWLWKDPWLFDLKEKKKNAYLEDSSAKAKELDDTIRSRMQTLYKRVYDSRKLGVLGIVFNVDIIKQSSQRNIRQVITIALIITVISCIVLFIVLNYMVKNLKKLEDWALSVGKGNLDEKIRIAANDEIGRLGDITNYMIGEIKKKYHLEKFVSRSTRSMIERRSSSDTAIDLGVTGRRNFAFIFADIRGFTSFSEKEKPETVVEVLNFYFELQSRIIKKAMGDIDDYVGDQIMAHFSGDKKADRAVSVALEIMTEIVRVNGERRANGLPVFEIGIGVHSGDVVVGNIGSSFRMDFTSVGDAVNLTSRLCSIARAGEIIVSRHLFGQVKNRYKHVQCPAIEVKGKEKKIEIVKLVV